MKIPFRSVILVVVLATALAGTAYMVMGMARSDPGFVPILEVAGDVQNPLALAGVDEERFDVDFLQHRGHKVRSFSLEELLDEAAPRAEEFELLLIGDDGRSAIICSADLGGSRVVFTEEYGWEAVNPNHSISSNVKMLREIVVVADLPLGESVGLMSTDEDLARRTVGEIYRDGYRIHPRYVGSSSVQGLKARVFERVRTVDLERAFNLAEGAFVLVVGADGQLQRIRQDGLFLLGRNTVSYAAGNDVWIEEVRGLILDPPRRMITDVYHDAVSLLEADEPVLLILLDGLGYHQYLQALELGRTPFLGSLPDPEKALAVYPAVTPVNYASAVTGVTPDVSGVHERGIRRAEVPTIFGLCLEMDWQAVAVQGPIAVIDLEIDPVLCMDADGDGSTDDDKRDAALSKFDRGYDLVLVHFKDIDNVGHSYGPLAEETLEAIERIDGYVGELVRAWSGHVIVFSDHGMHVTGNDEKPGDHGEVRVDDMIIPYWIFDGGNIHE